MIEKNEINAILNFQNVVRPKSLIITIMGDVAAVHGRQLWSVDLVKICQWFNISEYSSRISFQRLLQEGWLQKKKDSFFNYFQFTPSALEAFELNQSAVYQRLVNDWKEGWQAILIQEDTEKSKQLIKDITWMGYRKLYKNFYLFPGNNYNYLENLVQQYSLNDQVIFMKMNMQDLNENQVIHHMIKELWNTPLLEKELKDFHNKLTKLISVLDKISDSPEISFYTRLKLIHEYRRIVLKHGKLPQKIHKQGHLLDEIYNLMGKVYHRLREKSSKFIIDNMKSPHGKLPDPNQDFFQRFDLSANKKIKIPEKNLNLLFNRRLKSFVK